MKPRIILFLGIVSLAFLVSACGGQENTDTEVASVPGSEIMDTTWQWTDMVEAEAASQAVIADSQNYTIVFNRDNTINIQADCNSANGTYTLNDTTLTVNIGPMTLAACSETSQDQLFLTSLAAVERYSLANGRLQLHMANEGQMGFNNSGPQ